jgi:hypothetical protein
MLTTFLRKIKRDFAWKTANGLSSELIKYLNALLYYVGIDIFNEDYTWLNLRFGMVAIDCSTYILINLYSVYYFWGDLLSVAFCLVTFTMGFQVNYND